MLAAARAESARINKVAAALRKDTAEQLRRSREMEEVAGRREARSDGISIVQRPKRAAKVLLNLDGTEIAHPVKGRCGELRGRERVGGRFDHDAAQEEADAEMGEQLRSGKRKAAKATASKVPAKYVSNLSNASG
jgi:hypothetical protein